MLHFPLKIQGLKHEATELVSFCSYKDTTAYLISGHVDNFYFMVTDAQNRVLDFEFS